MRHLLLLSFALPGALLAPGSDAGAQGAPPDRARAQATVTGVVRDTAGAPVAYADVAGAAGRVLSDTMGRFLLENVPPGRVVLQVRRIGYRAASWSGTAGGGERLTAELTLVPIPRDLEAVVVEASGGQARRMRGFYQRRQRNGGHFLTRDDIAPHDDSRLTDLLRARVPGVSLTSSGPGPTRLRLRNQRCAPMVWIDGASTPAAEFDVDVIQPFTVAAIEVYPGTATTPAEFRTSVGRDNCGGTIVIWSRMGPVEDESIDDAVNAVDGTRARFEGAARAIGVPATEAEAWISGFEYLQLLRLQVQLRADAIRRTYEQNGVSLNDPRIPHEAAGAISIGIAGR